MYDFEHSINEDRYIAIGKVGDVLFVVFTEKKTVFDWFPPDWRPMQKGFIMIKTLTIENGQRPTTEQLKEVEDAKAYPIVFDEECQELSPAMMKAFRSAVVQRNRNKKA